MHPASWALDNKLEIKGSNLQGVYGSAEFVGWYNGHPDYVNLEPNLNTENVVVIGNGNVAIDIVVTGEPRDFLVVHTKFLEITKTTLIDTSSGDEINTVSYTHLTLPTNREV